MAWLLAGVAAALLSGCSSGSANCINACGTTLTITAAVPPIGQDTWTVHVCFITQCGDVTLDANDPIANDQYGDLVSVGSKNGAWQLAVQVNVGGPESGETWSVKVTNAQGSVIAQGSGPVNWQGSFSDCSCPYATATIP